MRQYRLDRRNRMNIIYIAGCRGETMEVLRAGGSGRREDTAI